MRIARTSFLYLLILLASPAAGSRGAPAGERADLGSLAFMAGHWSGEDGGVTREEVWLEPRAGLMIGLHRDVGPSGRAFFEFLRIEQKPEGIVYLASPQGRPATPFPLASRSGNRVVFENPSHDYPRRIIYWRDEADALHARVEGEENGKPQSEEWTWRRAAPSTVRGGGLSQILDGPDDSAADDVAHLP